MTKSKRHSLKHMTPDEKAEYVRERERRKKARQRERAKTEGKKIMTESPQAKVNWPRATITPELEEFIDVLVGMELGPAAHALALWERENQQRLRLDNPPIPDFGAPLTDAEIEAHKGAWAARNAQVQAYRAAKKRADRFALTGYFAGFVLENEKARGRNKRYLEKEVAEANRLGISIDELKRRKRAKRAPKRREEQFAVAKGVLEMRIDQANAAALKDGAIF